ncbi:hypothetical protein [Mycolicibacterium sp. PDY-3]|uniref:hypothetical protein n=1 Tax=Mycolicibacterium sp. PDY-3 TaxID=3376069 RepID=UPI0037A3ADA7
MAESELSWLLSSVVEREPVEAAPFEFCVPEFDSFDIDEDEDDDDEDEDPEEDELVDVPEEPDEESSATATPWPVATAVMSQAESATPPKATCRAAAPVSR